MWGRESDLEFGRRVVEIFYDIYHSHPGQTVVVVTHGRAISAIMCEVMRISQSQDFRIESADTSIHHFVFSPEATVIKMLNDTRHLL